MKEKAGGDSGHSCPALSVKAKSCPRMGNVQQIQQSPCCKNLQEKAIKKFEDLETADNFFTSDPVVYDGL